MENLFEKIKKMYNSAWNFVISNVILIAILAIRIMLYANNEIGDFENGLFIPNNQEDITEKLIIVLLILSIVNSIFYIINILYIKIKEHIK